MAKEFFRDWRRTLVIFLDIIAVSVTYFFAFLIRFDFRIPPQYFEAFIQTVGLVVVLRIIGFWFVGLYKGMWRYASINDLINVFKGVSLSSVVIVGAVLFIRHASFPRSVLIIDYLLNLLTIGGIRFTVRLGKRGFHLTAPGAKRILIFGAGDTGELIGRQFLQSARDSYRIVGYIDDDPKKKGLAIHGIPVLGNRNKISQVILQKNIDELILTVPSLGGESLQELLEICKNSGIKVKTVPSLLEIIEGKVGINKIREVKLEDLLNREPVESNLDRIMDCLYQKKVLVTGAGGTIGSELSYQIARFDPQELTLLDYSENNLFHLGLEFSRLNLSFPYRTIISDLKDETKMERIFQTHRPQIVFHAAAYKHVPMMERNPSEAVRNNIISTDILTNLSEKYGVEKFILVSTDKAVDPTSIMGATKRVMEMIIQSRNGNSPTKFIAVRFGNVLGSSGSVVSIFKEQIKRGGPVLVTHPEAERFFMTVQEAVQLIIEATALGAGGEIFVLDMGKRVKIIDLAKSLITLSGFKSDEDIKIEFTGLRPGEKIKEEILGSTEKKEPTSHKDIFIARSANGVNRDRLEEEVKVLVKFADEIDTSGIINQLRKMIPSYRPNRERIK